LTLACFKVWCFQCVILHFIKVKEVYFHFLEFKFFFALIKFYDITRILSQKLSSSTLEQLIQLSIHIFFFSFNHLEHAPDEYANRIILTLLMPFNTLDDVTYKACEWRKKKNIGECNKLFNTLETVNCCCLVTHFFPLNSPL
jgi:hypothetical protein